MMLKSTFVAERKPDAHATQHDAISRAHVVSRPHASKSSLVACCHCFCWRFASSQRRPRAFGCSARACRTVLWLRAARSAWHSRRSASAASCSHRRSASARVRAVADCEPIGGKRTPTSARLLLTSARAHRRSFCAYCGGGRARAYQPPRRHSPDRRRRRFETAASSQKFRECRPRSLCVAIEMLR